MSFISSILESRLDLSMMTVLEPGPGLLVVTDEMSSLRMGGAVLFSLVCLACSIAVWRIWNDSWLDALWPWSLIALFSALFALLLLFARQQKSFNSKEHSALIRAGIGPIHFSQQVSLPIQGEIQVTFIKEYSSSGDLHAPKSVRCYNVDLAGLPSLGFTVAGDRASARNFAQRLAKVLNYSIKDEETSVTEESKKKKLKLRHLSIIDQIFYHYFYNFRD